MNVKTGPGFADAVHKLSKHSRGHYHFERQTSDFKFIQVDFLGLQQGFLSIAIGDCFDV